MKNSSEHSREIGYAARRIRKTLRDEYGWTHDAVSVTSSVSSDGKPEITMTAHLSAISLMELRKIADLTRDDMAPFGFAVRVEYSADARWTIIRRWLPNLQDASISLSRSREKKPADGHAVQIPESPFYLTGGEDESFRLWTHHPSNPQLPVGNGDLPWIAYRVGCILADRGARAREAIQEQPRKAKG